MYNEIDNSKVSVKDCLQESKPIYLLATRLCLLAIGLFCITAYTSYYNINSKSAAYSLFTPIAILFAISAFSILWAAYKKTTAWFSHIQFSIDVIFITTVIWITGAADSKLTFLYYPIIFIASLFSNNKFSIFVSLFAVCNFLFLKIGLLNGFFDYYHQSHIKLNNFSTIENVIQFIGLFSGIILSACTAYYIKKITFAGHKLAVLSNQALTEYKNSQILLENELSEGIITTDINGNITHANTSAEQMFNFSLSDKINTSLRDLLSNQFNGYSEFKLSDAEDIKKFELTLDNKTTGEKKHFECSIKSIINTQGETTGYIHILNNHTKLKLIEEKLEFHNYLSQAISDKEYLNKHSHSLLPDFVGETIVMKKVFKLIERVAPTDSTVLVYGESGTGKELVAKSLHLGSPRHKKPFVAVNCGAIPESLIESQLFGHKRGSFTGANSDHLGFFQEASGGTIFLDEIGELPLHLQSKLLRTLQEKVIRPVGAEQDIAINVRVVSATNKNLKEEVVKGNFREDLFYRLNVISIALPALRDRKDDLPLLIQSLLRKLKPKDDIPLITPQAMELLLNYDYKGNIRELENILERALVLGGEIILPEHLPESLLNNKNKNFSETQIIESDEINFPLNLDSILSSVEQKYLKAALIESKGAKKKAAEQLGMNFRSFRYRLQKYGIDLDNPE
jgi:two-component system response regulator PilR (NtrC family)